MGHPLPYSLIGTDLQEDIDIAISQKARQQGLYIIGTTGTGKSTLLANLILADIRQGLGVCLIEPHGDLTNTVLAGMPENRLSDVIYLDITDDQYPFGLNLFQCPEPRTMDSMAKTASFVHHVFEKLWGAGTDTPRLMQVLRAVTRTLMENPGTTFAETPLLFSSDIVREKMVANLTNSSIVSFWEDFNARSPRLRDEYIDSTRNKIMSFLDEPMVRNIVAQSQTTIDFRSIMDHGKVLLVKLSPQFKDVSLLIGTIVIGKLLMAAWSREDTEEDQRRQFNLYCDEYQRFATSDLKSFIDEARKFRVAATLSHQSLSQLDEDNRNAATGAANMIVFRVTGEDGKQLAKNFDTTPTQMIVGQEPQRAPVADVISHLIKRGHTDDRVTRFGQTYLEKCDSLVDQFRKEDVYVSPHTVIFHKADEVREGRALLNETLYRCMSEKEWRIPIPPLALYILALAANDRSEEAFRPYIKTNWIPPYYFLELKDAEEFGNPSLIDHNNAARFVNTRNSRNAREIVTTAMRMITECRYTMERLARDPILVDTGQYQPKYQARTYIDMENEIASKLTQQANYQAKVRLLTGEHDIRTNDKPVGLSGSQLAARINNIKRQMRMPGFKYCRSYLEVEKEIRERQERWKGGRRSREGPPPTHM